VPGDTPRVPQGPRALPGQYTVRLTADGKTYTAPLTLKMDPRVKTPPAGLEQQFQAEKSLASMMTQAAEALLQSRSAAEQLHKLAAQANGPVKAAVAAFESKLADVVGKPGGAFSAPSSLVTLNRVNADSASLYGDVDRADAAPNAAQVNAMAETQRNFAAVMRRWNGLKSADLPALNRQLRAAGLPPLQLRAAASAEAAAED
jgi:hypothetical protein